MIETAFVPSAYTAEIHEGKTHYRAPSNIALVKYWGKKENQVPANPSISFTLDAGANVHVLYPFNESSKILEFIKNELVAYCQNGHYICDQIGLGANQIE